MTIRDLQIVAVSDGLGNQLFCWAYGRALEFAGNRVLYDFAYQRGRRVGVSKLIPPSKTIHLGDLTWRVIQSNYAPRFVRRFVVRDPEVVARPKLQRGTRLHFGHWQSLGHFAPFSETIRLEAGALLPLKYADRGVCAIHVRRGDYVSYPQHGLLPTSYYVAAVEAMRTRGFERFVVVSDDRDFVRNEILPEIGPGAQLAPLGDEFDDLAVISNSGAAIIANSTFSWWGAFLGGDHLTAVIAPEPWFADRRPYVSRIVPDHWLRFPWA